MRSSLLPTSPYEPIGDQDCYKMALKRGGVNRALNRPRWDAATKLGRCRRPTITHDRKRPPMCPVPPPGRARRTTAASSRTGSEQRSQIRRCADVSAQRASADLSEEPQRGRDDEPEDVGRIHGAFEQPHLDPGHILSRTPGHMHRHNLGSRASQPPPSLESADEAPARAADCADLLTRIPLPGRRFSSVSAQSGGRHNRRSRASQHRSRSPTERRGWAVRGLALPAIGSRL
jgi:hypothetical protein